MANVRSCFTCKICESFFVDPVILPCGNSVCLSHTEEKELFNCQICSLEHTISIKDLIPNKFIEDLIATKIHENFPTKKHQQILNSFSLLEKVVKELENLENNPQVFISEFFDKLINKIDIKREEVKIEFEENFLSYLKELDTLKNDPKLKEIKFFNRKLPS